jgi:hypothetical protein
MKAYADRMNRVDRRAGHHAVRASQRRAIAKQIAVNAIDITMCGSIALPSPCPITANASWARW